ncbi:MAG TPA: glycosyltransferase [Acidobacteriota bacterium]|nr:glycosyltransferase [Acidobacteriota bacterium]
MSLPGPEKKGPQAGILLEDDLAIHLESRWPHTLPQSTRGAALRAQAVRFRGCEGESPSLSIVIPLHNQLAATQLCLHSLAGSLERADFEVILVDNASGDGTRAMLEDLVRHNPCCRTLFNDHNRGFAPAVNQGLSVARGRHLVILNNDTLLPPGWWDGLQRALQYPSVGLAGPCTNKSGNESEIAVEYRTYGQLCRFARRQCRGRNADGPLLDLPMLSMFCLAMRRGTYRRIGPLDERFQVGMFEDDDYSRRTRQLGLRTVCVEDSFVHHFGQATFSARGDASDYQSLMETNRRRYEEKWGRPWRPHRRRPDRDYQRLRHAIAAEIDKAVPPQAGLLVASKGDDQLLRMLERRCRHLPAQPDGTYAGHHPADSGEIIGSLRRGLRDGFEYLLLPQTTLWWLDHYGELASYLESGGGLTLDRPGRFQLYRLRQASVTQGAAGGEFELESRVSASPGDRESGGGRPVTVHSSPSDQRREAKGPLQDVRGLADRVCLVAAPSAPAFDRQSGDRRLDHLISLLQDAGAKVRFWAHDQLEASSYLERLRGRRIECFTGPQAASQAFSVPPDLALVAFWELAAKLLPLLRSRFPDCRIVADSVDLHLLRRSRQALLGDGLLDPDFGLDFVSELNAYACCDGVLAVSEKEAALIGDLLGRRRGIHAVPDYEDAYPDPPPLDERRGLVFLGNQRHCPNRDAVSWLTHDIVPLLGRRLLASHPLSILGHADSEGGDEDVRFLGWVEDVKPLVASARLSLAPLRFGAGTKRKVIESLLCSTPCVCTPVAAEGLGLVHEEHVLIAEDAESFAGAVKRLLEDDRLWQRLSQAGRGAMRGRHSRGRARQCLQTAVDDVLSRPPQPAERAQRALRRRQHWMKSQYEHLLQRMRVEASQAINGTARVGVISRGDDAMLALGTVRAVHFPADASGRPLWHHPADSRWAIDHLQQRCERGLTHLLIPASEFWWLEHYSDFAAWLDRNARLLHHSPDTCRIYQLGGQREEETAS